MDRMNNRKIKIKCSETAGDKLFDLINYLKFIGNVGHSFEIIVDPDTKETKKSFFYDGDGSDYIKEIKMEEYDNDDINEQSINNKKKKLVINKNEKNC